MPIMEYSIREEKYFAKHLTAEMIASEPDTPVDAVSKKIKIKKKIIQIKFPYLLIF